ncbi:hypothetical protein GN496_25445 [Salmonella enterica]|nr:hypothetical protein [Salmonella enterica]
MALSMVDGAVFTRRSLMAKTTITSAFNRFRAQEFAGGRRVILDEFVLAFLPDLDTTAQPDPETILPDEKFIVHRQATDRTGMVNENTVAYSMTLPESVGNFTFNWLALVNSETGTPALVTYLNPQQKISNAGGVQGNVLTYSEILSFDGAASQTGITTPVSTWQIDFTQRLYGMDETVRMAALDIYGTAIFMGDAFKLTTSDTGLATISPGIAYIRGLRTELDAPATLTFSSGREQTIYIDVAQEGTLTGINRAVFTLINQPVGDYTDALGRRHFTEPLAVIAANGHITDLRKVKKSVSERLDGEFLTRTGNLKEIADSGEQAKSDARRYLGLGDSATLSVGTVQNTVAAGDDPRIEGAMQKNQNGADIPDKAAFIEHIGMKDTINPTKRVSIGRQGNGAFDGSAPCINIGDSDSGFIGSQDGVLDIYCNNARVGYIDSAGLHMLTDIYTTGALRAGDARFDTNGDVYGTQWGGWLRTWLDSQFLSRDNTINACAKEDWVNRTFSPRNTASLETNGWFKDASTGLIIQWGITGGNLNKAVVNLPIPFPNAGLWSLGWVSGTLDMGNDDWSNSASLLNNSQLTVTTDHWWSTAWIAIGK